MADDWTISDLAALYPDEKGLQPPPDQSFLSKLGQAIAPGWYREGAVTPDDIRANAALTSQQLHRPISEQFDPINVATSFLGGPQTSMAMGPAKGKLGEILGLFPSTSARTIYNRTLGKGGGYSVNIPTGEIPTEGLMVGRYKNTDPRTMVVPREDFNLALIRQQAEANAKQLAQPENYFGTWLNPEEGKIYLDVAQRFAPDKIRQATKAGERVGQIAGYNVGTGESFPIGNWRGFVAGPEYESRLGEMADVGRSYLAQHPTPEWWDIHGTPFERVYGTQNLPQVAGFSAATAPMTNPRDNMREMTEYMRRFIKGEPIVQPDWRMPEGGAWLAPGRKMPLEQSRVANLEKAARGDIQDLQLAKVANEARAMMGDPTAVVIDRHHVRLTEDPSRGIFAGPQEGVIRGSSPKRGVGDYDFVKNRISNVADAFGRDPRDFSADVWTGIRETIKNTDQLYGTKYRGSAVAGESKSYADHFQDVLNEKANKLGISVDALEKKLRNGDANLLSTVLAASPVLWSAYRSWEADQAPGGLGAQDQYQ